MPMQLTYHQLCAPATQHGDQDWVIYLQIYEPLPSVAIAVLILTQGSPQDNLSDG